MLHFLSTLLLNRRIAGALAAMLWLIAPAMAADPFPDLPDLPTAVSADGVVALTMTETAEPVTLGPVTIPGMIYNRTYAGPVLRVRPGDRMNIRLVNQIGEPTNLHFHGIQTSPLGASDNAHIAVPAGESFQYSVLIPITQPPGTYWYHTHLHGIVERQVMSGLSGTIVVEGFAQQFPVLAGIKERLFVLKEYEFDDSDDPVIEGELHGRLQTINGLTGVTVRMRPGETQLWHLTSQAPNKIFHLSIPGHRFRVLGEDGVARNAEAPVDTLHIIPGARVEALVDAGEPGTYDLISEKILTGRALSRVLGHIVVAGEPAVPVATIQHFPARDDLRLLPVDTHRTVTFSQDSGTERFFLDGRLYDHGRMDTRVPLGSIQEWTLRNETGDFHEFHMHQVHFQIVAVNGQPVPFEGYRDVVRIPEQGAVTIRIAFLRPEIIGTFFYHCHVLKHEDRGMMANIEVYDPAVERRRTMLSPIKTWLARLTGSQPDALPYAFCGL